MIAIMTREHHSLRGIFDETLSMTHLLRPGRLEVETDLLLGAEEVLLPEHWHRSSRSATNTTTLGTKTSLGNMAVESVAVGISGGGNDGEGRTIIANRPQDLAHGGTPSTSHRANSQTGFDAALFESNPAARRAGQAAPTSEGGSSEAPITATRALLPQATTTRARTGVESPASKWGGEPSLTSSASPNSAPTGATGERLASIGDSIAPPAGDSNAERLEALRLMHAASCPHCTIAKGYTNLVFGEGNPHAELVFVGEAPGESEDLAGRPFVGKAGEKLDEMIRAMGLSRGGVYIANVLKARPPENRTPLAQEMERCGPYLLAQLAIIRPKAIVTLGGPATKLVLQSELGITRLRGVMREVTLGTADGHPYTVPVMPTFHPAYLLRNYTVEVRKQMWEDLKQVLAALGRKPSGETHQRAANDVG